MEILEIIPFNKSFKKETLSYFSTQEVPIGSIVTIELRKKDIRGIVVSKKSLRDRKADVRASDFKLKKVKSIQKNTILNNELISSANDLAEYFATSTGAIINSIIPKFVLDNVDKVKKTGIQENRNMGISLKENAEKYVLQEPDNERFSSYKRLIREEFAKKKSVIFVCPTIEDTRFALEKLSKGIEESTFVFHGRETKTTLLKNWNKVISIQKPVLIICTGIFLGIPRDDIGSIVIERENSYAYRSFKAPYLDYRIFAEIYARRKGARFFLGDLVLRLETLLRLNEQEFYEFTPMKYRDLTTADSRMVDMSEKRFSKEKEFVIFSEQLEGILRNTLKDNEYTMLFTSRRGLSPTIVCLDCGHTVECNNCEAPMILHGPSTPLDQARGKTLGASRQNNFFLCHRCSEKRSSKELCRNCGSWKLHTLGIGSTLVEKETKKMFPDMKVFVLDSDHANTKVKATKIINDFYANPGSVLVGTEMALLYLHEQIENVAVVSVDSMFSNPDFNINEKILNTILKIKSKATRTFTIQTRKADEKIFNYIINGNIAEFLRLESDDRRKYDYPPFSMLIKIIIKGTPKGVEKEFINLREFLKDYELIEYPIIRESTKAKVARGALLKFPRNKWPRKDLVEKLKMLPAYYKIVVNAENIF
jgi:primosomal protein N'